MFTPRILEAIQRNAGRLAHEVIADLKQDPLARHIKGREDALLEARVAQVYEHLAEWLSEKDERRVAALFEEVAQVGFQKDVPISELVYALIQIKQHLWRYLQSNILSDTVVEMYHLEEIIVSLGRFFDTATHDLVREYESLMRGVSKKLL